MLRETWPLDYECEVSTPAEAIRALGTQFNLGKQVQVKLVGCDSEASIYSPIQTHELHVVPDFTGGGGGWVKILIGVVIIIAAIVITVASGGTLSPLAAAAISFGVSLVLGGILELLTPAPKTNTPTDNGAQGRYLGTPKNTTKIGTRIPIVLGRFPVYGHYISFGVASNPSAEVADAITKRQAMGLNN